MATPPTIPLPRQWPNHLKAGILHAIGLAGVAITAARAGVTGRRRLQAELEQAETEIAQLREELAIKDGRWRRSRSRRRPHYTPTQRMRILQLRAARGWSIEKTAEVFLVDVLTLRHWMRRLDEHGERSLVQTVEPVNRYPDFVRNLVRQLKRLFPAMGNERMAQVLARAGLRLGTTTIRRMIRESGGPSNDDVDVANRTRGRIAARYPVHTWHLDLTTVPTRAGFWVSWFPFSAPQRWPFCWWVAVAVDQTSRMLMGFAVYRKAPSAEQVLAFLARAIRTVGEAPRYLITDQGRQFVAREFRRWCKRQGVGVRYGRVGEPASIAIVERFIRSMKQECTRVLLVPTSLTAMRRELRFYSAWFNQHRPHMALGGRTPWEAWQGRRTLVRRVEPRPKGPHRARRRHGGHSVRLHVSHVEGRKHLPVVELQRAA